jgi:hypothetical protein
MKSMVDKARELMADPKGSGTFQCGKLAMRPLETGGQLIFDMLIMTLLQFC